ncbi:MAG: hypothetical protein FWH04_04430 [Oscillospiraceae bacterium]|nr:hypothetical protein [Oscillospiraceae bacterium]
MSANFELKLFVSKLAPYREYTALLAHCFNGDFTLSEIFVIDDWAFENQRNLGLEVSDDELSSLINKGKIVFSYGSVKEHSCGVGLCQEINALYEIGLWISSKHMPFLDDNITSANEHIYQMATDYILKNLHSDLVICGIGSELSISYRGKFEDIILTSSGVDEWIVPQGTYFTADNYSKTELQGFDVWCLK